MLAFGRRSLLEVARQSPLLRVAHAPLSLKPTPLNSLGAVRHRTTVKGVTKAQKRYFRHIDELAKKGIVLPKRSGPTLENKFWKVVGDMKIYKNVTPGTRHRRHPTRFHLWKGTAVRRLSVGKRGTGGRNNTGRITTRHRGGGHKKRLRKVDFFRRTPGGHEVVRLEYDPNRSAELALLRSLSTNEFSYVLRQGDVKVGDVLYSWRQGIPENKQEEEVEQLESVENSAEESTAASTVTEAQSAQALVDFISGGGPGSSSIQTNTIKAEAKSKEKMFSKAQMVRAGNCLRLADIPVGTIISCISLQPHGPAVLCRSAGTYAQLISTANAPYAQVRLSSKEVRLIHMDCVATIGAMGNANHGQRVWGKAGARRRKGWRPAVRGIAMSPFDHPHGGGRKSKGGKAPRSPWGWKTKGKKTVNFKKWHIVSSVRMNRKE
ncbi:translation protein SH3-like domain-containing protein [Cladochytrium replicatum]|nr:translation protein SH3-like domain-containing protein [Cladochytrium replicatum]